MKKLLLFLLALLTPFFVSAEEQDIEIKEIKLLEKSEGTEELSAPVYEGLKVNFDLKFNNVNDKAKYQITLKNNTSEDFLLEDEVKYSDDSYIAYDIKYTDKELKGNKEATATMTVSYYKEIPVSEFDDGEYIKTNKYTIDLQSGEKNPYTRGTMPYVLIGVLVLSLIVTILLYVKQKSLAMFVMCGSLVALPFAVDALRKVSFEVDSKVHITDRPYVLDTTVGSFDEEGNKSITVRFTANKYIVVDFYTVQWGQRQRETDNLILNVVKNHFTENSYVKAYDEDDNLLAEVTLADFPRQVLNVNNLIDYGSYHVNKSLGVLDKEQVRLEISEDLQEYEPYDVAYFMYSGNPAKVTANGPWIEDRASIEKLFYLEENFNTDELVIKGFQRDTKDSHLYHAIWGEPDKIK